MKRICSAIALALALLALGVTAQAATRVPRAKGGAAKNKSLVQLNANNWAIYTTNYGPCVYPRNNQPGGTWGGASYNYIYGGGLWVGALDTSSTPHVAVGYNPNTGASEFGPISPVTGDTAGWATDPKMRVYLSTNPADLTEWPLRDSLGDPVVKSTQDGYAAYSDENPAFTFTGETPVGVRVDQFSYSWNFAQLSDIVFFRYTIKNLTDKTLNNVYLGPCFDADIGDESGTSANDRTDFDYTRNLAIQYQTDPEPGWPRVGYFGCRFFESPRNNTGDTVHVIDNQFPHDILPDSMLGMTAFKIFTIDIDPATDPDRYHVMQGYNYKTMVMDAYDELGSATPGDKRFVMASGPFNLAPGDSVATCVSVLAAYTRDSLLALSDYSQLVYNNGFTSLPVTVTGPNGGEILSGTTAITWSCPAPACTISVFTSADGGLNWTKLADSLDNSGTYSWNTAALADGVRYKVCVFARNADGIGGDQSDNCFTVNNAVDAHPEVALIQPWGGEDWSGDQYIKYAYGHADNDLCRIQIQLKGCAGTWDSLTTVNRYSQLWTRDSLVWNTATVPNYPSYIMRLRARDSSPLDTAVAVSGAFAVDNPFPQTGPVSHPAGSGNGVIVNPYVWDAGQLTGHSYEFRFKNIKRGALQNGSSAYNPLYNYDLWDATLNSIVLADRGLSVAMDFTWQWDVPPAVDGFIPEVRYRQAITSVNCADSARITGDSGAVSLDTLSIANNFNIQYGWMSRGTAYRVVWHVRGTYPNDTLSAEVWDLDNNVAVPLDTLACNSLTQSAWSFAPASAAAGRSFITSGWPTTASRSYLFICGAQLWFNRGSTVHKMTWATHPSEGEVWSLYTSGYKPPRQGDVFSFTGVNGVGGAPAAAGGAFSLFQNAPNPFGQATALRYQLAVPSAVSLKVYNIAGQLVKTLVDARQAAGMHSVRWCGDDERGRNVSAGVYLYRLRAGGKETTRKLVLMR
ncbi:MAG TPA: T9SS type A sorting domain-containing protein [Candidatus Edwardsbacteria bacterium]|nr:T9SS type A sorting domain-containing protein [Candidatus Edwardsbacteria bacterium]